MNGLIEKLRDEEIQNLRQKYHDITGEWLSFHWDCFKSIDEYKEHMRKTIEEYEAANQ